jgi:hypothetical protein
MLLSLLWFENCPVAYYFFAPLSRRAVCENACGMAVMRNDVAKFLLVLKSA